MQWHARRACARIRLELLASIYDKALKRKDFSGVEGLQDKTKKTNTKVDEAGKARGESTSNAESGKSAETGKIVQLMSGDADRVAQLASFGHIVYG